MKNEVEMLPFYHHQNAEGEKLFSFLFYTSSFISEAMIEDENFDRKIFFMFMDHNTEKKIKTMFVVVIDIKTQKNVILKLQLFDDIHWQVFEYNIFFCVK